ncbi:MAG: tetratricopeptide repeat protein, partial [Planctomycetota bacterium]
AQEALKRALEINPRLTEAWLVKADLAWANFRPEEAARVLEEHALRLNPVSEEALGRLAACRVVLDASSAEGGSPRLARLIEEVTGRNEHAGEFFFTLASWLKGRHKTGPAETFFKEAIRRMPQLIGPKAQLGMLWMDSGREADARQMLEEAFDADPFNVRVDNLLKVLDVLDTMETLQTRHCLLKFDAERDRLLARYAGRRLDALYEELSETFGYRPPERPLVEVFNQAGGVNGHQWFSTRMIGLPYLGTVAASTGRMVGMVSPNEPAVAKRFNWAQVLRHELVHVITLQQTDFNVPHWYTEALAVWSEGYPRPPQWNELLRSRVPKGDLFDLKTINFGFTRPNSSDQWHMAYCQAELYVDYMLEGRSPEVLRRLLAAYADNLTTEKAIPKVFGLSEEQFERGYREYLEQVVAGLSGPEPEESRTFAELLEARREKPDDADLAAQVAYGYLRREANEEALQVAEEADKLHPKHQLAAYVRARLHVEAGQTEEAVELLEACLDRNAPDFRVLNLLAGLKLKAEEYDEAAQWYGLGAQADRHNVKWDRALARVYLKQGDDEKLAEVLARIARTDPDDLVVRKKLTQLALAEGDFAAAARWANQALEIDVQDAEIHRAFAEAMAAEHNYTEAIEAFETAIELEPTGPDQRLALARTFLDAGKPRSAREVLKELLRLDPDHLEAGTLLEEIEEKDEP